jgi:hypothetical protein
VEPVGPVSPPTTGVGGGIDQVEDQAMGGGPGDEPGQLGGRMSSCQGLLVVDVAGDAADHQSQGIQRRSGVRNVAKP